MLYIFLNSKSAVVVLRTDQTRLTHCGRPIVQYSTGARPLPQLSSRIQIARWARANQFKPENAHAQWRQRTRDVGWFRHVESSLRSLWTKCCFAHVFLPCLSILRAVIVVEWTRTTYIACRDVRIVVWHGIDGDDASWHQPTDAQLCLNKIASAGLLTRQSPQRIQHLGEFKNVAKLRYWVTLVHDNFYAGKSAWASGQLPQEKEKRPAKKVCIVLVSLLSVLFVILFYGAVAVCFDYSWKQAEECAFHYGILYSCHASLVLLSRYNLVARDRRLERLAQCLVAVKVGPLLDILVVPHPFCGVNAIEVRKVGRHNAVSGCLAVYRAASFLQVISTVALWIV